MVIVRGILEALDADPKLLTFVEDRPGHDRRCTMDVAKVAQGFGWQTDIDFETGLAGTVTWYERKITRNGCP